MAAVKKRLIAKGKSRAGKKKEISVNKHGQAMGRKGAQTRQRLLEATLRLLKLYSPVQLTAVSIAKEAKTSSATFYIYFNDVHDVLFALSEVAGEEMAEAYRIVDEAWDPHQVDVAHARRVVDAFNAVWDRHRDVLRVRNLEADRGDPDFGQLRISNAVRFIERFAEQILKAYPDESRPTRGEAFAEATALYASMEGLAETDPVYVEQGRIGAERLSQAVARLLARSFAPTELATKAAAPAPKGKRRAA